MTKTMHAKTLQSVFSFLFNISIALANKNAPTKQINPVATSQTWQTLMQARRCDGPDSIHHSDQRIAPLTA